MKHLNLILVIVLFAAIASAGQIISSGGVDRLIAGAGITVNPTGGVGTVTVTSTITTSTTTATSSASITLVDAWDSRYELTAQAGGLTITAPASCVSMDHFLIRLKDNGGSQTITYSGTFRDLQDTRPTTTTAGKWMYLGFYCNASNTLDFVAYNVQP